MNRTKIAGALAGLGLALAATPSHALLELAATVNGVNFCATDNNVACSFGTQILDTSATVGTLALGNSSTPILINGLSILGSVQTQQIAGAPGQFNILNSSSLTVTNTTGANIVSTLSIGATNFAGPSTQAFTSGSGTFQTAVGSSAALFWFDDPLNRQGGETNLDREGIQIDSFLATAGNPVDSFSHTAGPIPVSDPALYSMTLGLNLTLTPGGQLISRGQTEVKNRVPEPGTLALLGVAALGMVGLGRKRKIAV